MNEPNLVILAGGIASRMKKSEDAGLDKKIVKEANEKTKSMISIGRGKRPFMDYLVHNAREAGYKNIHIVISEKDNTIRDYYSSRINDELTGGINFSFSIQQIPEGRTKPLGTADALLNALTAKTEWKGQTFSVVNSDNLYSINALETILNLPYPNALINYDKNGLALPLERVILFAVNEIDDYGFLTNIHEKPEPELVEKIERLCGFAGVSMNLFRFSYDMIFPFLVKTPFSIRDEKELPDAVRMMIREFPKSLFAYRLSEPVPDLTSKSDILKVEEYIETKFGKLI